MSDLSGWPLAVVLCVAIPCGAFVWCVLVTGEWPDWFRRRR